MQIASQLAHSAREGDNYFLIINVLLDSRHVCLFSACVLHVVNHNLCKLPIYAIGIFTHPESKCENHKCMNLMFEHGIAYLQPPYSAQPTVKC